MKTAKRHFATGKRGFTLTEFIVAVAVIVVLTAIAIPAISGIISNARMAGCSSNLRQLGAAGLLYVQDNGGKMFPYRSGDNQSMGWNWLLMPYVGFNKSQGSTKECEVFICPERTLDVKKPTYYLRFTYCINNTLVAGPEDSSPPLLNAITSPQNVIFFADSGQVPQWSGSSSYAFRWKRNPPPPDPKGILSPKADPDVDDSSNYGYFRYRHNGSCNAVFIDGHVDSFRPGEVLNENYYSSY
ncbi:prepilin-type N-terminal cleavage/methylation domain-containing protein [Ruficoccus amylovorans]|uniref:Prepilin-type N-terminal cleavage/methylation domain-containing protein n=1 Tax=Ruficoccus amylovorans TaxID=1804625 RepID=A0A842HAS7_9BACT|nr:prepilin-type N-terminal cleavage/methylation domain-containing protein [Ruficoccus amylovorans]MBC2592826.1 prepilin-type N-terminal cleavage/methylation domain-containing protein [Ruficoccus amylovorans]